MGFLSLFCCTKQGSVDIRFIIAHKFDLVKSIARGIREKSFIRIYMCIDKKRKKYYNEYICAGFFHREHSVGIFR